MKSNTISVLIVSAIVGGFPLCARAAEADAGIELAFMPSAMDVTLLNEGGKFVAIDMKKIAKGEKCRMDKDDVIIKVGPGETAGAIRVRSAVPQFSSGGCPFMTEFELPEADYTTARAAFTAKKDEASKKVKALKKQLGNKWKEVTGQIGPPVAKEEAKKTTKAPHIYSQVECTGMKKMHWDDATQTCQKNK